MVETEIDVLYQIRNNIRVQNEILKDIQQSIRNIELEIKD